MAAQAAAAAPSAGPGGCGRPPIRRGEIRDEPAARHRRGHLGGEGGPLRRSTCARSPKPGARSRLHHPRPGWVEQDAEEVAGGGGRRRRRAARRRADGEVVACGLDHQGESVLAWDAESGRPLTPIVTWQDKRSQEVLARLEADRDATRRSSAERPAARPLLLGRQARPGCSSTTSGVAAARDAGTLRLGTVDSFICDRLGAGFATDPSTASRTQLGAPEWDPELLELFGVPRERSAGDRGHGRRAGHARASDLARRAAAARPLRRPAGGAGGRRLRRPRAAPRRPTGPASSSSPTPASERPSPAGGLLPTIAWRVGGQGRVGARRRRLHRRRAAGLDEPRPRARRRRGRARRRGGGGRGQRRRPHPAGAERGRRAMVAPRRPRRDRRGIAGRPGRAHLARAALEAIAWRVADVLGSMRETVAIEALRVDGGPDPQRAVAAAAGGHRRRAGRARRRRRDRRRQRGAGRRRRRPLGLDCSRSASGYRSASAIEPTRDAALRDSAHAEWRRFVERAAEL